MKNNEKFFQLHNQKTPLLLANVWNVKSAQVVEACGFQAMGTSSGAIADSLGYKDGEQIPFDELLYVVQRIKASTTIPLSVDLERGYTDDQEKLIIHIDKLIEMGIAGINLEDAQGEEIYLKKLTSIKNHLVKTNQSLFLNARTDGFLQKLDSPLEITLRRAKLYQDAGADGLFVTGVQDPAIIQQITSSTTLPINVVGQATISSVTNLAACGVRRISMAASLYKATYSKMETMAKEILHTQSLEPLFNK